MPSTKARITPTTRVAPLESIPRGSLDDLYDFAHAPAAIFQLRFHGTLPDPEPARDAGAPHHRGRECRRGPPADRHRSLRARGHRQGADGARAGPGARPRARPGTRAGGGTETT